MIKNKMIDNPVVYLRLNPGDKKALDLEADRRGMPTSTLTRMLVLEFLNKCTKEKNSGGV
jgi:hypothetical protein